MAGRGGHAVVHRMAIGNSLCPHGLKSVDLLRRRGFAVDDRLLRSREETDAFKAEHDVRTTPQTFIDGVRIGGYDDLRRYLGLVRDSDARSYWPVLVVFATAAALGIAVSVSALGQAFTRDALRWSVSFAMALLAMLKLRDVDAFATMFLNYDLLARRWVRYASIYPWAEGLAGVLMAAGVATWLSAPLSLAIGGIGTVSVLKAVYVDRRALRCACVGGGTNVPLGFLSLTENVAMVGMGVWMIAMPMGGLAFG